MTTLSFSALTHLSGQSSPLNRSSMSSTVRWAAPSSCVKSAWRGIKTLGLSPVGISCVRSASKAGRYSMNRHPHLPLESQMSFQLHRVHSAMLI